MVDPASGTSPNHQEDAHPQDFDYTNGSPHLKHPELRREVESSVKALVASRLLATGRCRVLEVGAGHGDFTDLLVNAGAHVTVTEMSGPSAARLAKRFAGDSRVKVIHDSDASWVMNTDQEFDTVVCISVLHHIPDYFAFFERAAQLTAVGGSFVSWQDPTWYPRRTATTHRVEAAWYYFWRVRQGEIKRGVRTRVRRIRGIYDESEPADMSEYHVTRDGIDDLQLRERAAQLYESTQLIYYWSTQSAIGQRLGARWNLPTNFALIAECRSE